MGYGKKPRSTFRQTKLPVGVPKNRGRGEKTWQAGSLIGRNPSTKQEKKKQLKEQVIHQIQANGDSVHVSELLSGVSRKEKASIIDEMTREGTVVIDHDDYGNEWVGM
jgi:hypothetical protein